MVEPLVTRYIRIYPERATPAGLGLRLELLGCEIEGAKTSNNVLKSAEFGDKIHPGCKENTEFRNTFTCLYRYFVVNHHGFRLFSSSQHRCTVYTNNI